MISIDNLDLNFYSLNSRAPTTTYYLFLVLLILLVFSLLLSSFGQGEADEEMIEKRQAPHVPTLIITNS
jgi:hypothetical protein